MPTYDIVVTDVTRYGSLYCVAGWDLGAGVMIRPEPPGANNAAEASRFWNENNAGPGKFFAVGNRVQFNAAKPPAEFPFPHATEDRIVVLGETSKVVEKITEADIVQTVAQGLSASLAQAFGGHLQRAPSGKAYVAAGTQTRSLDAIEVIPASIKFYEENQGPNKRRLRARLHQNGVIFDLSVPADAARTCFLTNGVAALTQDVQNSARIHVRLGLCRPFAAMPNSCYAQVNGLYFL